MPRRIGRNLGGYILLDAIIGIIILGILAGVMVDTMRRSAHVHQELLYTRAAARLAESRLVDLESGVATPTTQGDDANTVVTALPDPSPERSMQWVRVRATVAGRAAELVGLVPVAATTQPAGAPSAHGGTP